MRRLAIVRVDATREQPFEAGVDARLAECFLHERIEAERGKVAVVEHDGMAKRNRLTVVGVVRQQTEELARPCPRA